LLLLNFKNVKTIKEPFGKEAFEILKTFWLPPQRVFRGSPLPYALNWLAVYFCAKSLFTAPEMEGHSPV
jgi:hypothetical protein